MLSKRILVPVFFAAVLFGCSEKEETVIPFGEKTKAAPKTAAQIKAETIAAPKTAAQIKAETIAEFEKIIGGGIQGYPAWKDYLPTADDWDKYSIASSRVAVEVPVFKFSSAGYEFRHGDILVKGSVFDLKKKKNGIFTLSADTQVTKSYGKTPSQEGEKAALLVRYNIETKFVEAVDEMHLWGRPMGCWFYRFYALPIILE